MQEIQRNLARLQAQRGDPDVIAELDAELRILQALYAAAGEVFAAGNADNSLRQAFSRTGLGEWSFANVYNFVYERSIEIELGRRELSSLVGEQDYVALIRTGA